MKKRNKILKKEILYIFIILCLLLGGIFGTISFCQENQEVSLTAYYNLPIAAYDVLRTRRIIDRNDSTYCFDPGGNSNIESLQTSNRVQAPVVLGTGEYAINFTFGDAFFQRLEATGTLFMGAPTPAPAGWDNQPLAGKHVYDVSEGFNLKDCDIADVAVISKREDLTLTKSRRKFDTKVAGVISESPKIYLRSFPGLKPLALAGIVKCKVTAENGPIKNGDLLVTSAKPGHAMRADAKQIRPGMLIGSALEPLTEGSGTIYILVNQ